MSFISGKIQYTCAAVLRCKAACVETCMTLLAGTTETKFCHGNKRLQSQIDELRDDISTIAEYINSNTATRLNKVKAIRKWNQMAVDRPNCASLQRGSETIIIDYGPVNRTIYSVKMKRDSTENWKRRTSRLKNPQETKQIWLNILAQDVEHNINVRRNGRAESLGTKGQHSQS